MVEFPHIIMFVGGLRKMNFSIIFRQLFISTLILLSLTACFHEQEEIPGIVKFSGFVLTQDLKSVTLFDAEGNSHPAQLNGSTYEVEIDTPHFPILAVAETGTGKLYSASYRQTQISILFLTDFIVRTVWADDPATLESDWATRHPNEFDVTKMIQKAESLTLPIVQAHGFEDMNAFYNDLEQLDQEQLEAVLSVLQFECTSSEIIIKNRLTGTTLSANLAEGASSELSFPENELQKTVYAREIEAVWQALVTSQNVSAFFSSNVDAGVIDDGKTKEQLLALWNASFPFAHLSAINIRLGEPLPDEQLRTDEIGFYVTLLGATTNGVDIVTRMVNNGSQWLWIGNGTTLQAEDQIHIIWIGQSIVSEQNGAAGSALSNFAGYLAFEGGSATEEPVAVAEPPAVEGNQPWVWDTNTPSTPCLNDPSGQQC